MGLFDRFRRPQLERSDASISEVRAYFEDAASNEEHYPSSIDPRILFVRRLLEHLGDLSGKTAADIGSGKGRFARIVKEQNPEANVIAVDIAEAMLKHIPAGIGRAAATMTHLPLATESIDGAWAIESLEHAIDIEAAVAELTRIVKPGGKIVIIDKNADKWGQLETPSWERWFDRRGLDRLLRLHCREVSSGPISYWEDVPPDGLFLAWFAQK
ncbi:MAG: class I SAM-dependent methyltransferase [Acidobacteriota bacterium]